MSSHSFDIIDPSHNFKRLGTFEGDTSRDSYFRRWLRTNVSPSSISSDREINCFGRIGVELAQFLLSRFLPVMGCPDAVVCIAVKTFEAVPSTPPSDVGDNAVIVLIVDFDHSILQRFMVAICHGSRKVAQRMLPRGSRGAEPRANCNRPDGNRSYDPR
jgi:hypothetical protein